MIEPDYIPVWLEEPVPALGDEKPIDLLAEASGSRSSRWFPVSSPLASRNRVRQYGDLRPGNIGKWRTLVVSRSASKSSAVAAIR